MKSSTFRRRRGATAASVTLFVFGERDTEGAPARLGGQGHHLLGVRAVVARPFEASTAPRVGMDTPLSAGEDSVQSLGIDGTETYDLLGLDRGVMPRQDVTLVIRRPDGTTRKATLTLRVDILIEVDYLNHGGILPYVLRQLLAA